MVKKFLVPFLLFLLSFYLIGRNLNKPFVGIHDWNGARYGNIARNYLRYGFLAIRFAQIENGGETSPAEFRYYTHYQPLLPILISFSYRIFGVSEWSTRLIPLLATSGTILSLYFIGQTIFGWEVGLGASLLALATPMVRYFGKNPVHEPLALFFSLLTFLGAAKISKHDKSGWYLLYLGLTLTLLTNWSSVFLIAAVTLILIKPVGLKKIRNVWLLGILFVALHFLHVYLITGNLLGGGLKEALLERTSLGGAATLTKFTFSEFINRLRIWFSTLFTISLSVAAILGFFKIQKEQKTPVKLYILGLLIYCLGYPLALPNATFIHNYFIFGMTAFVSLCAAYFIFNATGNRVINLILFSVVLTMVWFERSSFLTALENSRGDQLAVDIGKKINLTIPGKNAVLVTPFEFAASRQPHLSFYSNRDIILDPNSRYSYQVEVDEGRGSFKIKTR